MLASMAEESNVAAIQGKRKKPSLSEKVESVDFRVFNRVAATKPLKTLLGLLTIDSEATSTRLFATDDDDQAEDVEAYLHVASALQPDIFGIRIGAHFEDEDHVLVVDAALEYSWSGEVDYSSSEFDQFLQQDAAPRAAAAVWVLLDEVARSLGAATQPTAMIPGHVVAGAVRAQIERHPTDSK